MAKYALGGAAYTFHVDFKVNGEPVVPTAAKYTLRNNAETVVASLQDITITLGSGNSYADFVIPSGGNAMTLTNNVRYIDITFTSGGIDYVISDYYILLDSIRFPLSSTEIRSILGVSETELPEQYIDILDAYRLVQDDAPDINTDTILTTGTSLLPTLIEAVKYKAALVCIVGVQNFTFQMEQADNTLYKRFASVDFKSMQNDIALKYAQALRKLNGVETATDYPLAVVSTPTDKITGV